MTPEAASFRLLTDFGVGAADGLAADEAMMHRYHSPAELAVPTVRLYTYADHCALVGRYQHLDAEVNISAAESLKVGVGRRPTGGGAIIMGADQLGVAVATRARQGERPRQVLARMAEGIIVALASLGLTATFKGKNDLEVQGRKIAGLGLYADACGALLFHASILADLNVELMLSVLNIPAAKLGDKAVSMVRDRVCTISELTGSKWDGKSLMPFLADGFAQALGVVPRSAEWTHQELTKAAQLAADKYGSQSWLRQRRPNADATACALVKTSLGLMRCYMALQGNVIKSVLFTGDFNELPADLATIEKALRWQQLDPQLLLPRLQEAVGDSAMLDPLTFVSQLIEASAIATNQGPNDSASPFPLSEDNVPWRQVHELAEPARSGSCYFPEVSTR